MPALPQARDRVGKNSHPIVHGAVAGQDDGFAPVAIVHNGVEILAAGLVDFAESKIIQDQQIAFEELIHVRVELAGEIGFGELGK